MRVGALLDVECPRRRDVFLQPVLQVGSRAARVLGDRELGLDGLAIRQPVDEPMELVAESSRRGVRGYPVMISWFFLYLNGGNGLDSLGRKRLSMR
jgi:hypothetical protein